MSKIFTKETTGLEIVNEFASQVKGKTFVITGAGENGLGAETAIALAHAAPTHLVLLARTQARVDPVIEKIKAVDSSIKVNFVAVSLDDFDSVRKAAGLVNAMVDKIDILINNAGIMNLETYQTSKHGHELQFATNHLGHFLFTKLVLGKVLAAGPGARIINLSSSAYDLCGIKFDDYNFSDGATYDGWSAYGQTKTANILFSKALATRLQSKGVLAYSVHPGIIFSTTLAHHIADIGASLGLTPAVALKNTGEEHDAATDTVKPIDQGISTTILAALDPQLENQSGCYLADNAVYTPKAFATSPENADRLWKLSEDLVKEQFVI